VTTARASADDDGGGLRGAAEEWWLNVRSGQLGSLPIIIGLIIIAIVFQSQKRPLPDGQQLRQPDRPVGCIRDDRDGIVFVLLLGEIDLSVGYVSGVGGVIAAVC